MPAMLERIVHEMQMPSRRIDALNITWQTEAHHVPRYFVQLKDRLVSSSLGQANPVLLLASDGANFDVKELALKMHS